MWNFYGPSPRQNPAEREREERVAARCERERGESGHPLREREIREPHIDIEREREERAAN